MRLYVVNVGVNTGDARARGLRSPRFPDGSFELVTIPEVTRLVGCSEIPTYGQVRCWTRNETLARFVPQTQHQYPTHLDPEFGTFTYGDIRSSRASNLRNVETGDQMWFLARLWDYDDDRWLGGSAFYFIGLFIVETNLLIAEGTRASSLDDAVRERIKRNAHYLRLLQGDRSEFRVLCGDVSRSRRFRQALHVSRDIAGHIYGGEWNSAVGRYIHRDAVLLNKNGRPRRYETFGSVTRTVQSFLNSENADNEPYLRALSTAVSAYF
jgi:hypothetical protein